MARMTIEDRMAAALRRKFGTPEKFMLALDMAAAAVDEEPDDDFEASPEGRLARVFFDTRPDESAGPEALEAHQAAFKRALDAIGGSPDFKGMPRAGGAQDAAFANHFPGAAAITIDRHGEQPVRRPPPTSAVADEDFAKRYPSASQVQVL